MIPYEKCCLRKMFTNNHIVIYTFTLRIAIIMESFLAFEITIIVKFCELSMSRFVCIEVDHHTLWNFGGNHYSFSLKKTLKMTMGNNYVCRDLWSNLIKLWKMKGENTMA